MTQRVLLVEDSPTMRSFVAAALQAAGDYDLVEVPNGFEALKTLPGGHFELVITDINMPDINGLELIRFIRSNAVYRDVPLIIISTEGSARDRERGLGLGANAFLVKPFTPEELVQTVHCHLPPPGRGRDPGSG